MDPKPGQIWKENDNRFTRHIRVLVVRELWVTVVNINNGRTSQASKSRFNGKSSGYSLVEDVKKDWPLQPSI